MASLAARLNSVRDGGPRIATHDDEGHDAETQILEYYSAEADQSAYGKLAPALSHRNTQSSGSSNYSTDEAVVRSLRRTPRSPRGQTHRRVQVMGMASDSANAALVVPADISIKSRPLSLIPNASSGRTRRAMHNRSRSDPLQSLRSESSSEYSDTYDNDELDSIQSPLLQSHDPGLMSPVTPSEAITPVSAAGPLLVGFATKDLAQGFQNSGPYIAYQQQHQQQQQGVQSSSGPVPRLASNSASPLTTAPPPRPPRAMTPSPRSSRRTSTDMHSRSSHDEPDSQQPGIHKHATPHSATPPHVADAVPELLSASTSPAGGLDDISSSRTNLAPTASGSRSPSSVRSMHSREGAFPPSAFIQPRPLPQRVPVSPSTFNLSQNAIEDLVIALDKETEKQVQEEEVPPPSKGGAPLRRDKSLPKIVHDESDDASTSPPASLSVGVKSLRRHSEMPPSRSNSSGLDAPPVSLSSSAPNKHHSMDLRYAASTSRASPTPSPSSSRDELPEIPQHERNRAYPRTPSSLSLASASAIQHIPTYDSTLTVTGKRKRRGGPDIYPPTMLFQDILKRKTPLDRCAAYAHRFNGLMEDSSGLDEWVHHMRHRHKAPVPLVDPNAAEVVVTPVRMQVQRHVTGASVSSEFPIRPDAYVAVAVDLTPTGEEDFVPPTGPPPLPYPALANGPIRPPQNPQAPINALTSPTSTSLSLIPPKATGGFFSSISRKTSLTRKLANESDKLLGTRLTLRRANAPPPTPRPVQLGVAPSIPGGPRAPSLRTPGPRIMRSNTVGAAEMSRRLARGGPGAVPQGARPPPATVSSGGLLATGMTTPATNDAFTRSLKGMIDILPHVDRTTLALYLRRADGKEINAISAYLADEKEGRVARA